MVLNLVWCLDVLLAAPWYISSIYLVPQKSDRAEKIPKPCEIAVTNAILEPEIILKITSRSLRNLWNSLNCSSLQIFKEFTEQFKLKFLNSTRKTYLPSESNLYV